MPALHPPPAASGVPYAKLWRWGWFVVRDALGWFSINTALTLLVQTLVQVNVQVLALLISALTSTAKVEVGEHGLRAILHSPRGLGITFAVLAVIIVVLGYGDRLLTAWTDNVMTGRLQRRLHDKLLTLGPSYHRSHDVGLTTQLVMSAGGTQMVLRDVISAPLTRGVGLLTALYFLQSNLQSIHDTGWPLRFALILSLVLLPIVGARLVARTRKVMTRARDADLAVASEFGNSASMPLEVQLMGAGTQRAEAFGARVEAAVRARVASSLRAEGARQFQKAVPELLAAAFLLYGALRSARGSTEAGSIVALFYFVPAAVAPIQQLLTFASGLNMAWVQIEKVVEVLEARPDIEEREGAVDLAEPAPAIALEGVTFRYDANGPKILDGVSHTFAAGKVSAVVARIGQGKSSMLNLVARVRDPDEGTVRIGTHDVRDLRLGSLHRCVAKVSQFPLYVTDTVRANMQLARADASDAEIRAVCEQTGLWPILQRVSGESDPLQYVLPRGASEGLSGGQRRLLAITRALLCRPSVLLLDEPTTGLDAIAIRDLIEPVRRACRGLTAIVVDHGLEDFVCHVADEIISLDAGHIVERGTPAVLARGGGLFQSLLDAGQKQA